MKPSLRFGVLLVLILVAGVLVNAWSYLGEAHVERKELKAFPQNIGAWQKTGNDQILDDETLKVLRASDYLLRDFRKSFRVTRDEHQARQPVAGGFVNRFESVENPFFFGRVRARRDD